MEAESSKISKKPLRSQAARDRILAHARQIFADIGFERTTIRAVAAAAEIHPSMVMRYFHSKEELFASAAAINFHMPHLASVPLEDRGKALITHVLEQWEGSGTGRELQVLLRAAGTHDLARKRFVQVVQQQAVPAILEVIAKDRTEERLALILVQIAGLVVSRYLFAYEPVVAMKKAQLIQLVGSAVQAYLVERLD